MITVISGCINSINYKNNQSNNQSNSITHVLDTEKFFAEYPDVRTFIENLPEVKELFSIYSKEQIGISVNNLTCDEFNQFYSIDENCLNLTQERNWLIQYYSGEGSKVIITIDSKSKELLGIYSKLKYDNRCEYKDNKLKFYWFYSNLNLPKGYIYVNVEKPLEKQDVIEILRALNDTNVSCTMGSNETCDPFRKIYSSVKSDVYIGWNVVEGAIGAAESYTAIDENFCVIEITSGM